YAHRRLSFLFFFFFFQAEDGIRDFHVTGVQTCALPIFSRACAPRPAVGAHARLTTPTSGPRGNMRVFRPRVRATGARQWRVTVKIGRASGRERVESEGGGGAGKENEQIERRVWEHDRGR